MLDGAENNVALLHLSKPLSLNEFVNVVDIPNTKDVTFENENCTLLGFGEDLSVLAIHKIFN